MKLGNILIIFLLLFSFRTAAQIIKDSIYIVYDQTQDQITEDKRGRQIFKIKNSNYEKELNTYKSEIKKIKKKRPYGPYPDIPSRFYMFTVISKKDSKIIERIENISFYDKTKLNMLTPYKKTIFIVVKKGCLYKSYLVNFYYNTIE